MSNRVLRYFDKLYASTSSATVAKWFPSLSVLRQARQPDSVVT